MQTFYNIHEIGPNLSKEIRTLRYVFITILREVYIKHNIGHCNTQLKALMIYRFHPQIICKYLHVLQNTFIKYITKTPSQQKCILAINLYNNKRYSQ